MAQFAGPEWFRHSRALKAGNDKLGNPLGFSPELGRVLPLTPLELACVSSKEKMVTWLIKNGANPDGAPGIHNGLWSALGDSFPSEATRNEAVLRALIDGGANLNTCKRNAKFAKYVEFGQKRAERASDLVFFLK